MQLTEEELHQAILNSSHMITYYENGKLVGLKFTVEMFLFDPSTGETYTEPRNDMDKTTIDACKGAIELLEQTDGVISELEKITEKINEIKGGNKYAISDYMCGMYKAFAIVDDIITDRIAELKGEQE